MDLTNKTALRTYYDVDPDTNILTITIKDESDVLIDTIIIENLKVRALIRALETIIHERTLYIENQSLALTTYNLVTDRGDITFV